MNKNFESCAFNSDIVSNPLHQVKQNSVKNTSFFSDLLRPIAQHTNNIQYFNNNSEIYTYKVYNHSDISALAITN